jgi:hypothetical protein
MACRLQHTAFCKLSYGGEGERYMQTFRNAHSGIANRESTHSAVEEHAAVVLMGMRGETG